MQMSFSEIHVLNLHICFEMFRHGYPLIRSLRNRKADVIGILIIINKVNT